MKIRILTSMASERWSFRAGQVIDVPEPTPEMKAWLKPTADGIVRAELVREKSETATVTGGERAVAMKAGR